MRVAIYSGAIPDTTFIDLLVRGVAEEGVDVYLFGTKQKPIKYSNKHIHIYTTSKNKMGLVLSIFYWFVVLSITHPNRIKTIREHIRARYDYGKIRAWGRYLPIMLHLPDVFHLQWVKGAEDWLFLKQLGVKMIVSFRGNQMNITPNTDSSVAASYRRTLPQYDAYHCVSKAILEEGLKYGTTLDKSKVIYPAVKEELLSKQLERKPSDTLRILSVGRDHWNKGYRVGLEAMALLKEKGVKFHYTIVAGGEKEELIYAIADMNLTDDVTLIDNLPHKKVFEQHANADVFLLPSFEEGVANVVLEAMALGTPVVTTNCGGMSEVIEDGVNGFIVPIRNPQALADAIMRFIKLDEKQKQNMTDKAKETIRQKHLLSIQVRQMVELYERVCHE